MKRTLICMILCLVLSLVLLVAPQAAFATEETTTETHTHCICGDTAPTRNNHKCEAVTWEPWTGTVADGGHYYLTQDTATAQITIAATAEVSICLNGHKLYNEAGRVFDLKAATSDSDKTILNVCDCDFAVENGIYTFKGEVSTQKYTATASLFVCRSKSEFRIFGGNFTNKVTSTNKSAIGGTLSGSNLTIYNGRFYGGEAETGGAINMGGGSVYLYGGVIEGGKATSGGNIYVGGGNLYLYGATIRNGEAAKGGNVFNKGGNVTINGSTISGGIAASDGGNIWNNSTLTIQNAQTKILDGRAMRGGNLFSATKATITYGTISGGIASAGGNIYGTFATKEGVACGPVIKDGKAGLVWDEATGSFIVSSEETRGGGNIYASAATTLVGATISGGITEATGGSIFVATGTIVELTDCTVSDGKCNNTEQSGNVYTYGQLILNGTTTVTGGTRTSNDIRNIYVGSGGSLIMGDTALVNGGVTIHQSARFVTLSGNPIIARYNEDGTLVSGARQLYFVTNDSGKGAMIDATELGSEAKIAVDTHIKPYTFANLGTSGAADAFISASGTGLITTQTDAEGNVTAIMNQAVARAVNGGQPGGALYLTIDEAQADENATYIRLVADVTEDVLVDKDLILDINGKTLTGSITGTGKLYVMDSYNDSYNASACGRIEGVVSVEMSDANDLLTAAQVGAARRYQPLADETGYTVHRVYVGITKISLAPNSDGMGYKAVFCADSVLKAKIANIGYELWLEGSDRKATVTAETFESGKEVTLRLKNFDVENYGAVAVNANVFMTMADGQVISGNQQSYSLLDMFRHVDAALASLNAEQIGALKAMYNKFAQTMSSWNLENLMAWTGEEETV